MKLSVNNLSISYGKRKIINNLSFEVNGGEIAAISGPNGSGKTTLCLALAGIATDALVQGGILIDGRDIETLTIPERCGTIGIIFQNPDNRLFSQDVTDELAFAPENFRMTREEIRERIDYAAEKLGIRSLLDSNTNSLSGGEKQLVAIASVLVMKPKIIISDEITSGIDRNGREKIRDFLKYYAEEGNIVIMVSHSSEDLLICNKRIILDGNLK